MTRPSFPWTPPPGAGSAGSGEVVSFRTLSVEKVPLPPVGGGPGGVLLRVKGDLDAGNTPRFYEVLEGELQKRSYHFVVNLSGVRFMGSSAFGALVSLKARIEPWGGTVRLCGVPPSCLGPLQRIGADKVLPLFDTEEAALKARS